MNLDIKLDPWQEQVLATKGNLAICCGRQVGKSTVIAIDAGEYAVKNKKKVVMVIAHVERQALLLFEKILSHIYNNHKKMIKRGKDRPTKHEIKLTNGTKIYCLPTGDSGYGIRGYTIDRLYADEAHFIKDDVWSAVTPMLATTGGDIILLSTPFGSKGYFYECFHKKDNGFTKIHINSEEVAKSREEPQRSSMLAFQGDEKQRMGKLQYQQEYLALFVGGIQRFFSDEVIDNTCILGREPFISYGDKFMGVDVARMGGDDTVLVSLDRFNREKLRQIDLEVTSKQYLTETARLIIHKDKKINHKKIYIDATGMGWGVFDYCMEHEQTRKKVIAIENVKKSLDKERHKDTHTFKRTMKEDLYNNLLSLMREKKIELYNDPELKQSLRSIQYENDQNGLKIYGNFSHITEALIRACWCMKDKSLNIWIHTA